ncbi:GNAT family N-acetyltransferase [Kineosporia sp. A_224]|uniref:GNAT family N-acetyltransferase n=1 Tax=Kineosporia sp. A_224 TaxID=1962180 RepID=UPI0018E98C80|nr:GNAT family protein [Kineosporia sp. A_224]
MADVRLTPVTPGDRPDVAAWLVRESWPFHADGAADAAAVERRLAADDDGGSASYRVLRDGGPVGLVRVLDLGDPTVEIDVRIAGAVRGQGLGTAAVRLLVDLVLAGHPDVLRIEAATRQDNAAMRAVLRRCGFVKEAHHRDAWPAPDGTLRDTVIYALLRRDHESGTTTPVVWDD